MKEYYLNRFKWIFNYTSSNFFYILAKTLCIVVGLPVYCVVFAAEMILTFVNMLFCWIPVLNVVMTIICKGIIFVIDKLYYINVLTDLTKFKDVEVVDDDDEVQPTEVVEYEVVDDDETQSSDDEQRDD